MHHRAGIPSLRPFIETLEFCRAAVDRLLFRVKSRLCIRHSIAERQACNWIARLHADDATAEDRSRFEAWLGGNRLNARAYESSIATWRELTSHATAAEYHVARDIK